MKRQSIGEEITEYITGITNNFAVGGDVLEDIIEGINSIVERRRGEEDRTGDYCERCGSSLIWRNSSDEMQCNNCGYSEGD